MDNECVFYFKAFVFRTHNKYYISDGDVSTVTLLMSTIINEHYFHSYCVGIAGYSVFTKGRTG